MCCGIPLQKSTKIVAVVNVVFGVTTIVLYILMIRYLDSISPGRYPRGIFMAMLICSVVQVIMSFVLLIGAIRKSRRICILWMVTAIPTLITWGLIIFIYELAIVGAFCQEMRKEAQVTEIIQYGKSEFQVENGDPPLNSVPDDPPSYEQIRGFWDHKVRPANLESAPACPNSH